MGVFPHISNAVGSIADKASGFARWLSPHGFVESPRRRLLLNRCKVQRNEASASKLADAVNECRYKLWGKLVAGNRPLTVVDIGANEGSLSHAVMLLCCYAVTRHWSPSSH